MKKLVLLFVLGFSLIANAQKPVELSDLLQTMIPETGNPKWPTAPDAKTGIMWKPIAAKAKSAGLKGKVQWSLSGKKLVFNDKYVQENVALTGTKETVTQISFETTVDYWSDVTQGLMAYFKSKKIKLSKIKDSNQGFYVEGYYEFTMPGKQTVWLKTSEFNNKEEMNTGFTMDIFFSKKDMEDALKASGI
jgi:hypothetical protein